MPIWFLCWIIPVCVFVGICIAAMLSDDDGYIPLGKQAWEAKLKAQYDDNADHFCPICGMHQTGREELFARYRMGPRGDAPLPPDILMDAHQDNLHVDMPGRRPVKAKKLK